ncbi:MAG: DUF92 domain-containing protein [Gemmatimonadota bacterium]|nr:DUF92 domain-containing protein [Gemmatimonadota bacterium]
MLLQTLFGALLGAIVITVAARARLLSGSGGAAAAIIGAVAVAAGWSWGIILVVFFALTSALSTLGTTRKHELTRSVLAKSGNRDAVQVLSNGGVFAFAAAGSLVAPSDFWLAAGAGAIAAAAADSWATEIGVAFGGEPRSISSGTPLPRGISGGVTAAGTLGGAAGAAVMAGTVLIIGWSVPVAIAAAFAGVLGMIIDSILGATLQVRRICSTCGTGTEQSVHTCGSSTQIFHGVRWMENDMVNTLATLSGAVVAVIVFIAIA